MTCSLTSADHKQLVNSTFLLYKKPFHSDILYFTIEKNTAIYIFCFLVCVKCHASYYNYFYGERIYTIDLDYIKVLQFTFGKNSKTVLGLTAGLHNTGKLSCDDIS